MKRLIAFILLMFFSNVSFAQPPSILDTFGIDLSWSFSQFQISFAIILMGLIFTAVIINTLFIILEFAGYDALESFKRGELTKHGHDNVGIYVQNEDGEFITEQQHLEGEFTRKWLDSETTTMAAFSNDKFDKLYAKEKSSIDEKMPFDWSNPGLDYLDTSKHPEIIGYNDKYFDDAWSGRSSSAIKSDFNLNKDKLDTEQEKAFSDVLSDSELIANDKVGFDEHFSSDSFYDRLSGKIKVTYEKFQRYFDEETGFEDEIGFHDSRERSSFFGDSELDSQVDHVFPSSYAEDRYFDDDFKYG